MICTVFLCNHLLFPELCILAAHRDCRHGRTMITCDDWQFTLKVPDVFRHTYSFVLCYVSHAWGSIGYLFRLPFLPCCTTLRYLYVQRLIKHHYHHHRVLKWCKSPVSIVFGYGVQSMFDMCKKTNESVTHFTYMIMYLHRGIWLMVIVMCSLCCFVMWCFGDFYAHLRNTLLSRKWFS